MSFARLRRVWASSTSAAPEGRPSTAGAATPKRVVFTCLFGDYETLNEQPVARRSKIDFICLTNKRRLTAETWSIKLVEGLGIDDARESRRPKVLPHLFLGDYDQSLSPAPFRGRQDLQLPAVVAGRSIMSGRRAWVSPPSLRRAQASWWKKQSPGTADRWPR